MSEVTDIVQAYAAVREAVARQCHAEASESEGVWSAQTDGDHTRLKIIASMIAEMHARYFPQ